MKTMETTLTEEKERLREMIADAEKRLKSAPIGHLRIARKKNCIEYYYKGEGAENENQNGRYLKKSEKDFARKLAQRDYDLAALKRATERVKAIDSFLEKYEKTSLGVLYENTNSYRRELIDITMISDEEFIRRWECLPYERKSCMDETKEIVTERGERVRSKSEKIIADKLYLLGIPYRYECPIFLDGNIRVYPDFTILKMPERKEVYLEHLGMMDDAEYINTVIYKLNAYERNGIYPGDKLFITHETSGNPLNTKALDQMLRKLFCPE